MTAVVELEELSRRLGLVVLGVQRRDAVAGTPGLFRAHPSYVEPRPPVWVLTVRSHAPRLATFGGVRRWVSKPSPARVVLVGADVRNPRRLAAWTARHREGGAARVFTGEEGHELVRLLWRSLPSAPG